MTLEHLLLPPLVFLQHGRSTSSSLLSNNDKLTPAAKKFPDPAKGHIKAVFSEDETMAHSTMLKSIATQPSQVSSGGISAMGDGVVTLFPRRKAGQNRPGGGRGPVVLNLEMLEQFYGVPLHVAAKKLVGGRQQQVHLLVDGSFPCIF